ncbi:MAG: 2TM domain-containing protein [Spirosomaceae bacterium]|nr:2TM domain-containing protein [Spirosomataceae bacterium]
MKALTEQQMVEKAKRVIGFKVHLIIFVLLLPVNWIVWCFNKTNYVWPIWPTLGWSLGVFFHWLGAFHIDRFFQYTQAYEMHLNRVLKAKQQRIKNSRNEK